MNLRISEGGAILGPECIPAGTLISAHGVSVKGRMVPDCPNCKGFADDKASHPSLFRMSDGVTHAAPDMWLASRGLRVERENGLPSMEAHMQAMIDWAWHCSIENARQA
jgi:hypothetical protein